MIKPGHTQLKAVGQSPWFAGVTIAGAQPACVLPVERYDTSHFKGQAVVEITEQIERIGL